MIAAAEMLSVEISTAHEAWLAVCPEAETLTERAARAAFVHDADAADLGIVIGIVLTDDSEQRELNRTYRGKDAPTNVLSFPLTDSSMPPPPGAPLLLGDVVLAYETVAREAAEQDKPLSDHLQHLVVHGVLHLLGFDHESDADAAIMEARETEILKRLGVPPPYRDTM